MEKMELLLDHYKETNELLKDARNQRNKTFLFLACAEFVNLLFMLHPDELTQCLVSWANEKAGIILPSMVNVFQITLWLLIAYFLTQYVQRNIYVERQYSYIAKIEHEIQIAGEIPCFNREGDDYLKDYPLVLNIIDVFYKWGIPLSLAAINITKIVFETVHHSNIWVLIIDYVICIFLLVVDIAYFCRIAIKPLRKR